MLKFLWCNGIWAINKQAVSLLGEPDAPTYFNICKYKSELANTPSEGWEIVDAKTKSEDAFNYLLEKEIITKREYDNEIKEIETYGDNHG